MYIYSLWSIYLMNSKLLQIIVEMCIVYNGLLQLTPPDVFFTNG